jgi:protein phosphatase
MGTTVVVASVDERRGLLHLGHVGDSRCYRIRDGRIELLTQDHTLINDVLELEPNIDDLRASRLPRNVITRALGMAQNVRASVRSYQLAPKDRYLICSDGLTDEVSERAILDAIEVGGTPEDIVRVLMGLAREAEAEDNVAVVVIGCELAPGVSSLPKPAPTQGSPGIRERDETRQFNVADVRAAPPAPKVPRTERATRDSDYPEIMVVGHGTDDSSPEIHIVPTGPADPGMLDAVQSFIERTRTYPPAGANPDGSWEDDD